MVDKNKPQDKPLPEKRGGWLSRFAPGVRKIVSRRDTPENLWVKDPDTGDMLYRPDLETAQWVTPSGRHMRINATQRLGYTFDDRLRYPFFTSWDGVTDLAREGTTVVSPQTSYIPEAELWIEAFEDVFARLNVSDDSDTTLIRYVPAENPGLLFLDDSPCGGFKLEGTRDHMRLYTDEDYLVNGGPVFLELDYRSNVVLAVGALFSVGGTLGSSELVYVTPTLKSDGTMPWNKIYIDLSTVFNAPVSDRDVYIDVLLPSGQSSAEVFIDNFKLVKLAP